MIDRTFQVTPAIGPSRERSLWAEGIHHWDDFSMDPAVEVLSKRIDPAVRAALADAREALHFRAWRRLQARLPQRERWRLAPHLLSELAYLDIETDGTHQGCEVTCIGVLHRGQVHAFVNAHDMAGFPAFFEQVEGVVTFNGSCFDLPVLERAFPGLAMPSVHIDLRFMARGMGLEGGLKKLEETLGIGRPPHLKGVGGYEAVTLWKAFAEGGSREALQRLVEYNLYDAVQLEPLLALLFNRHPARAACEAPELTVIERGDHLYDLTRTVARYA